MASAARHARAELLLKMTGRLPASTPFLKQATQNMLTCGSSSLSPLPCSTGVPATAL